MNGYFLIAGLLLVLLSVAHAIWGERRVFAMLTPNTTDAETYLSVYVPWHQLTGVLLSGVALLLTAFQSSAPTFVPIFILALITSNMLVFFRSCHWQEADADVHPDVAANRTLFAANRPHHLGHRLISILMPY